MKVVLDTNCLLQIVFPKSCYRDIWNALLAQEYTICLTNEISYLLPLTSPSL